MLRFFRRQRPATPTRLEASERLTAAYWGYTEPGWSGLSEGSRTYMRDNLVHAPNFKP